MNDLWQPGSDCGRSCLPGPGQTPIRPPAGQVGRAVALLGVLLLGAALLPVLPILPAPSRHAIGRVWARAVLRALGVDLVVRGWLPHRRALLVANHLSWLDVVAVLAVAPARLVAKAEVRRWPLIGVLAKAAGTIFVNRSRPRSLPATVAEVAAVLRGGGVVAVFAEGTTFCGVAQRCAPGPFRSAMFQSAIDAGALVVPLMLGYRVGSPHQSTTVAAFVGDDHLWSSVRRVLAARDLAVTVSAAAAVHPEPSATRRQLAQITELAVRARRPLVRAG
ncbi:MAG TPA: lysophospholipid acyltransferase family protein [Micromonosporaceae bacterium]|nr:lysophospholipid acyltransferase family protein [Micromonosporaceae bacterium]